MAAAIAVACSGVLRHFQTKAQFQAVLAGPPVAKTPHFALHLALPTVASGGVLLFDVAAVSVGVLVPKRWAKRAVTRNTIKRQIYEGARLRCAQLPKAAFVVRLRSEFSRKQFVSATSDVLKQAVRSELEQLWATALRRHQRAQQATPAESGVPSLQPALPAQPSALPMAPAGLAVDAGGAL